MKSLYKSPAILKNEITFVTHRDGFIVDTRKVLELFELLELFWCEKKKKFTRFESFILFKAEFEF